MVIGEIILRRCSTNLTPCTYPLDLSVHLRDPISILSILDATVFLVSIALTENTINYICHTAHDIAAPFFAHYKKKKKKKKK